MHSFYSKQILQKFKKYNFEKNVKQFGLFQRKKKGTLATISGFDIEF